MGKYDTLYLRPGRVPLSWFNSVVDALNYLADMVKGGKATFTGDGATKTFTIAHNMGKTPTSIACTPGTSGIEIDYCDADSTNIYVNLKTAPVGGVEFTIWWIAIFIE